MKKEFFLFAILTIMLFFGCKKDEPTNGGDDANIICMIVQPEAGQSFMEDEAIAVFVTAVDSVNVITEVALWIDEEKHSVKTALPYTFTIESGTLSVGEHTIEAVATNNKGKQGSTNVTITIKSLGDESPSFVTFANGEIPDSWKTSTWQIDVATGYDDNYSLRANVDAASVVTAKTISQPGYIEFFIKGETLIGDNVIFFIDNNKQTALYSKQVENNWKKYVYAIAPGLHQFRWETVYGAATYLDKITFAPASLPEVSTKEVSDITPTTAASGGTIISNGNNPITAKGICWSKSENPTIEDSKTENGSGMESFISQMDNLEGNTTYYVRAYATNMVGTAYGEQVVFSTIVSSLPTIITYKPWVISNSEVESGGDVTDDGFDPVTARGVCWNTSSNPTTSNNKTINGSGLGSFESQITGLEFGKTYYLRAYATNSQGTVYGEEYSFETELSVGEYYQGGYIAYLDETGEHGFVIADEVVSSSVAWTKEGVYVMTAASGKDVGTGKSNTEKIVAVLGDGVYAAKLCYDLVVNGYDDWFLPSIGELEIIMENRFLSESSMYWSSTEYMNSQVEAYAGYVRPSWGGGGAGLVNKHKKEKHTVFAIRYF